jgi:predicted Zn-dependent protease
MINPNRIRVLAFAGLIAPFLLTGCNSLIQKKPVAGQSAVVERDPPDTATSDLPPAQRGAAFRAAYNEGLRLANDGQYGLAIGAFEKAAALEPSNTAAVFNLGACHESIGDPLRAVNYYRRVLEVDSNDADCYRNLGTSFIKLYHREQSPAWRKMAYDAWRRSLQINPDQPDVRRWLSSNVTLTRTEP